MNILITTMGISWQIIPELLGFINPEFIDLFANHPDKKKITLARENNNIMPADEIWAVTTCGQQTDKSIKTILKWYQKTDKKSRPVLRIWQVKDTDNLATESECRKMSEAIHTIVYHGVKKAQSGNLMLSLTGGRKTMSTDLQHAAAWFGCKTLIHVVENPEKFKKAGVHNWDIDRFLKPLSKKNAGIFTPFCLGSFPENPMVTQINASDYAFDFPESTKPLIFSSPDGEPLIAHIEQYKDKASFLLSNYTNTMLQGETTTNFLALYTLPKTTIDELKNLKFGIDPEKETKEIEILKKLPKAELHCHLGGIANVKELIEIAQEVESDIKKYHSSLKNQLTQWQMRIKICDPVKILKEISSLKSVRTAVPQVPTAVCTASFILLFQDNVQLLEKIIFKDFLDKENFCGVTFDQYEKIGDLQGSALLTHPACLDKACKILAKKAIQHNVDYLEVRCSPVKYAGQGMNENMVCRIIENSFAYFKDKLKVSLIFTASRHGEMDQVQKHVALACEILKQNRKTEIISLKGFDLAGNEESCKAAKMQQYFEPVMKECMHFTIHAGEGNPADSIWEAVYYLGAERIGHGLTLKDNPDLMKKILDRGITLEMCPSSNFQIIGFKDNYYSSTSKLPIYPLQRYLAKGISVSVNTDNPGISDTDFTLELHKACRLTPGGLSLWEILSIIKNSFKASFASRDIKHTLLKKAEEKIINILPQILSKKGL